MCVPCAKKKKLNEQALEVWRESHEIANEITKQVKARQISEDQAHQVLKPLILADKLYVKLGRASIREAVDAFRRVRPEE